MSSFKEAREMLLLNHDMKVINDEELLLLLDDNTSSNTQFNYQNYQRFNLDEIQEPECKANSVLTRTISQCWRRFLGSPKHSDVLKEPWQTSWRAFVCYLGEQHTLVATAVSYTHLTLPTTPYV